MKQNKVVEWCDKVSFYSFCALIYFLPISTALVETTSAFILTSYFIKHCAFFAANSSRLPIVNISDPVVKFCKNFARSFKPESTDLSWPIGLFILVNFLSVITSQYPALGIQGFVCKLIQGTFLFFSFVETFKMRKQLQIFLIAYLASVTLLVINGGYQYFLGKGFVHGHLFEAGRITSSFDHPNDLGGYLVIIVPVLLSLVISYRIRRKQINFVNKRLKKLSVTVCKHCNMIIFFLFVGAITSIGLTFSRGAWLGLFVALVYLGFYKRKLLYISTIVAATFLILFYPQLKEKRKVNFVTDLVKKQTVVKQLEKQTKKKVLEKKKKEVFKVTPDNFKYLRSPKEEWAINGQDFTIHYWYYPITIQDNDGHFSLMDNVKNTVYFRSNGAGRLELSFKKDGKFIWYQSIEHELKLNEWNHLAIVRQDEKIYCFINGKKVSFGETGREDLSFRFLNIGFWDASGGNTGLIDGYIANFEIKVGQALWISGFDTKKLYRKLKRFVRDSLDGKLVETGKIYIDGEPRYSLHSPGRSMLLISHDEDSFSQQPEEFKKEFHETLYPKEPVKEEPIKLVVIEPDDPPLVASWKKVVNIIKSFGGSGRRGYWQEASNMLKDYPLLGVGLNAYTAAAENYKITWGGYPHNCFLHMAAETGLLGLSMFIWILYVLFRNAIRDVARIKDPLYKSLLLGFTAGLIGFVFHSLVDTNFYSVQLGSLLWVIMAIIVVIPRLDKPAKGARKQS